jgi:putative Mn2+ efflux pump MntP
MILTALLLAVASSTDNFAVGLGMGLAQKPLSVRTNGIISISNASGATIASFFGNAGQSTSWLSLLASLAFFYLAYHEFVPKHTDDDEMDKPTKNSVPIAFTSMAIPMTS